MSLKTLVSTALDA